MQQFICAQALYLELIFSTEKLSLTPSLKTIGRLIVNHEVHSVNTRGSKTSIGHPERLLVR